MDRIAIALSTGGNNPLDGSRRITRALNVADRHITTNAIAGPRSIVVNTGGTLTLIGDLIAGPGGVTVDVNGGGNLSMSVTSGILTVGGVVDLNAEGFVTVFGVDTTNGGLVPGGAALTIIAQGGDLTANSTLISGAAPMLLQADEIQIVGTASGTGNLFLLPFTAGQDIELGGAGATGALDLTAGPRSP